MAKRPLIFPRLSLLFLLCSSYAWVVATDNWAADGPGPVPVPVPVPVAVQGRDVVKGGAGGAEPVWARIASGEVEGRDGPHPRSPSAAETAHVAPDGCQAMITPPPSLVNRQDQGQIQALSDQLRRVSDQFRSVSQASQQVSQSSQQLSQSLQQATQRLSQTEQQLASARLQQGAAESASRSMSQASAEASRRADEAVRSVSQSASSAISASMASLASSMGASFSSALRLASQSAASVAQKAQEDATALRDEANSQIQQAQGAALSVTQTALAVVGGIVGSSLLTGIVFVLVLRRRRAKRRQRGRGEDGGGISGNIGYPQLKATSNKAYSLSWAKKGYAASDDGSSTYSTDTDGLRFPVDIKEPPAAMTNDATKTTAEIPRKSVSPAAAAVGYAVSYYGPRPTIIDASKNKRTTSSKFQLGKPPPPRGATTTAAAAAAAAVGGTASGGKFTLFPNSSTSKFKFNFDGTSSSNAPQGGATTTTTESLTPVEQQQQLSRSGKRRTIISNGSSLPSLSLDRWLRDGTDVSPFSTLKGGGNNDRTVLTHLIRAYLQTFARLRLETWLAHGTLLGWWWNGGIMPWDLDVDAQVTGATLALLADRHNGSLHEYEYDDDSDESSAAVGNKRPNNKKKKKRVYLLDVNPFATAHLDRGSGANVIDARWVDVDTGMYVDLTALADRRPSWELEWEGGHPPTAAAVMLSCKNGHSYRLAELFPLRETEFEGVPALVPWAYERVLIAEYGAESLILTEWEGHRWDSELREWIKKNETDSEETTVKHPKKGERIN
ncbi:LicD family-domain-containing protein [Corynascus novoguineensis]|uniref:LicD family-domain-containing protein n=1 Tax=Corynascus novoguineensis TaxID=1126955 RepID=A0AAN7D115_9PEZI|nr:LicD family-domain-containing protein [Corynascus novoguineensis]